MQRLIWLKVLLMCFVLKGAADRLYAASEPAAAPNDVTSKGEFRTWQTKEGRTARLAFMGLSNNQVQFRMVDGRIGEVSLARLCQADREWIANYGSRSAPSPPPAAPPEARDQVAFRTWQDVDGRTATLAFAGLTGDRVLFQMTDGRMAAVTLERLSPGDRAWLAAHGVRPAERGLGTQQFNQLKFVVELQVVPPPQIPQPPVPTPQPSVSTPQAPSNDQLTGPAAKCACVEGISRRCQTRFRCCQIVTHRCRCFLARLRYVLFARRCRH